MKLKVLVFVIFVALAGCEDLFRRTPGTCEVIYQVNTTGTYLLTRSWKLIGFQNSKGDIAYPPCEGSGFRKHSAITATFHDTVHNLVKSPYIHPYLVTGQGPVNGFGTSYNTGEPDKIVIQPVISTLIGSANDALGTYESKYFDALSKAGRFEITHNLLTLFDASGNKLLFVAIEE